MTKSSPGMKHKRTSVHPRKAQHRVKVRPWTTEAELHYVQHLGQHRCHIHGTALGGVARTPQTKQASCTCQCRRPLLRQYIMAWARRTDWGLVAQWEVRSWVVQELGHPCRCQVCQDGHTLLHRTVHNSAVSVNGFGAVRHNDSMERKELVHD